MGERIKEVMESWDLVLWRDILGEYADAANNSNNPDDNSSVLPELALVLKDAVLENKVEFYKVGMEVLPPLTFHSLLSKPYEEDANCLHRAASWQQVEIVKLILGFYKSEALTINITNNNIKEVDLPWLLNDDEGRTPLHVALSEYQDFDDDVGVAMEILVFLGDNNNYYKGRHIELVLNMVDKKGNSPLYYALKNKSTKVARYILISMAPGSYSSSGPPDGTTPLHHVDGSYRVEMLREYAAAINRNNHDVDSPLLPELAYKCILLLMLAALENEIEVYKVGKEVLPPLYFHSLLSKPCKEGINCLHMACNMRSVEIVRLILEFYESESLTNEITNNNIKEEDLPWILENNKGRTPLHVALSSYSWDHVDDDRVAMQILKFLGDNNNYYRGRHIEKVLNRVDNKDISPLYHALKNEFTEVAHYILISMAPGSYRVSGPPNGTTPLHVVRDSCPVEVFERLVELRPDFINARGKKERTVLHFWIGGQGMRPLNAVMERNHITPQTKSVLIRHVYTCDEDGQTPFHLVAQQENQDDSRTLAHWYRIYGEHSQPYPWMTLNAKQKTPVDLFLQQQYHINDDSTEKQIKYIMKLSETYYYGLFELIINKSHKTAETILTMLLNYGWAAPGSYPILLAASTWYDEGVFEWIIENFPLSISNMKATDKKYLFLRVTQNGRSQYIELILKHCPQALQEAPKAWVDACEKGDQKTVRAFIDNCNDFRELCYKNRDSPLHHIQLQGYENHKNFLEHRVMWSMKNSQDSEGKTPLHKAISKDNICLAEVLLNTIEVDRSIKANNGQTAMDLLPEKVSKENTKNKEEWVDMCKRVGIVPGLKTTYFQDRTNLLEVRSTLSLVAALLATITFTVGFTLPGGVQSDTTGKPALGNKVAFLVFMITDTFAMCCSMLVLICLVWSMVVDRTRSLLLIDCSMPILLLALYSTLVAFMTGVYVVTPHKSLWVAVVVLFMCSVLIIFAKRSIVYKLLSMVYPNIGNKIKDEEQGEADKRE